ncbi:permease [Proteinivorax hydrogeniformans]|uniref:Permease n=1 Tax=Proteinivorax hydrogeniformans TaxID=1826727 RepID=A0AAU8HPZ1_9FIRM
MFILDALNGMWLLMMATGFWFVIGLTIAGFIYAFLPQSVLEKLLGGKGLKPIFLAILLGFLIPVCSCGIIPIGVVFYKRGVKIGPVLTLCVLGPAINPAAIGLAYSSFGLFMTLAYLSTVAVGALCLGIVANLVVNVKIVGGRKKETCGCCSHKSQGKIAKGFRWAFDELAVDLAPALVYGLFVAGVIMATVPESLIFNLLGNSKGVAYPISAVIGSSIFICNIASIPLVSSLLGQGAMPGIGIILLIMGPATNISQLFLLHRAFGKLSTILYVSILSVVSVLGAIFWDLRLEDVQQLAALGGGEHGSKVWGYILIVILIRSLLKTGHKH